MSLINAIRPILGSKTAKVELEVSANPKVAGEMVVVARPIVGPVADNASEELKQLCNALSTGIKAIGTPETIERELAAAVTEQAPYRSSWDSRAAMLEARIAAGAQADATAASKTPSTAQASTAASAPVPAPQQEEPLEPAVVAPDANDSTTKPFTL